MALGVITIVLLMHGFAYLVLCRNADLSSPPDKRILVLLTGTLVLYGSLMLSRAIESVTRAFYGRGDLELILSSPVAAWRLFAVRIGAIATTVAAMSLALAASFIDVAIWFGGWRWLAAYGMIVVLAIVAVAVAVLLTVGLFHTIGPKRTRLAAQIVAAAVGAGFVIGVQCAAILSYGIPSRLVFLQSQALTRYAPDTGSMLWWPARAKTEASDGGDRYRLQPLHRCGWLSLPRFPPSPLRWGPSPPPLRPPQFRYGIAPKPSAAISRRRQTSSRIATFAEALSSFNWGGAGALAAASTWLAVIPGVIALGILAGAWRISPAKSTP